MHIVPSQDVFFDDAATFAMGAAFDQACSALQHGARDGKVRELLAKRIIEAARNGELHPIRLHAHAIKGLNINIGDASMPVVSAVPGPAYAAVAHAA